MKRKIQNDMLIIIDPVQVDASSKTQNRYEIIEQ